MATKLLLIRHAYTGDINRGKMVGYTDIPASPQGLSQAARLRGLVAGFRPDGWYSSPMLRARQTTEIILGADHGVVLDDRLREINFGRWEMMSYEDISAQDPHLLTPWAEYFDFAFPEGESVASFAERVEEMWDVLRNHEKRTIVVISHGGVIRKMICLALGLSIKNYLLFNVEPAKMTVLDVYPEGALLSGFNL
ncbi:MAG: histidine phosphatase family protein [Desulfobulbaceae bacterium]|nr:histidine phosphatase family protein [Desulfobulbaceae bacterium]